MGSAGNLHVPRPGRRQAIALYVVATPPGRLRFTHRKANSDRIMGRPAGNGEVPTPKRTMSPDNGTVGRRRQKTKDQQPGTERQGASPLRPRQGSRTLGTRENSLTAAPRTKEPLRGTPALALNPPRITAIILATNNNKWQ